MCHYRFVCFFPLMVYYIKEVQLQLPEPRTTHNLSNLLRKRFQLDCTKDFFDFRILEISDMETEKNHILVVTYMQFWLRAGK